MTTINEIIYIGDPMCSWCWGAAPALTKLQQHYQSEIPFRIILGGLRPYTQEVMQEKLKAFLRSHWEEIQALTGQPFGYKILERNDFIYDTEPAARAVMTVRLLKPSVEFDFFKAVQQAFYTYGKDTNLLETYLPLCEELFINPQDFEELFEEESTREATENDFEKARMLGVTGFPTVLIRMEQKHKIIARGYDTFQNMQARLEQYKTS